MPCCRRALTSIFATSLALAFGLGLAGSVAAADDPLTTSECVRALESLQARETALSAARRGEGTAAVRQPDRSDAQLERLRREAARACLGGRADPAATARRQSAQPPVTVPPITMPRVPAPAPPPARAQGMPPAPAPLVVTSCDALGCWANDGSRLVRTGPNLLGPRGLCSVHGALLHCP